MYFLDRVDRWQRLADAKEDGRGYRRLFVVLRPGFGDAADDRVVIWIDADTARLFRIHMTLNGFETRQGAHVDTTFLAYRDVAGYLLPVRFHERVRGPLQIDAHTWWTTGIDVDRGWTADDVISSDFIGKAEMARELLVSRIQDKQGRVQVLFSPNTKIEPPDIFELRKKTDGIIRFLPEGFELDLIGLPWEHFYREVSSLFTYLLVSDSFNSGQ